MEKEILVTRSSLPPLEEYVDKIKVIWESRWMTNSGPLHQEFQQELKKYLNCKNIELYVNGHMALDIAIKALGLKGEVITTPFTFASTTHALVMNGIAPVFCDIKSDDYTIDENKVEELITEETSAILAVHVYGQPCNVDKLAQISAKYNLKLIYDAAHAFGVTLKNNSIAEYGDISMFSFHATKVFNTIEGGALVFKDNSLQRRLINLRNFGIEGPESVAEVGFNAKMNEFSAAMGICNLKQLDENILQRKRVAELYDEYLKDCKGIIRLDLSNYKNKGIRHNYAYYPILIDEKKAGYNRDCLLTELQKNNIFPRKYFYPLVTDYQCYKTKYEKYNLPTAKYVAERVLTLPMYAGMEEQDISRICKIILEYKV